MKSTAYIHDSHATHCFTHFHDPYQQQQPTSSLDRHTHNHKTGNHVQLSVADELQQARGRGGGGVKVQGMRFGCVMNGNVTVSPVYLPIVSDVCVLVQHLGQPLPQVLVRLPIGQVVDQDYA